MPRFFFLIAGILGLVTVMLTHNRSAIVGVAFTLLVFMSLFGGWRLGHRVTVICTVVLACVLVFLVAQMFFPEQLLVYSRSLVCWRR